MENCANRLLHFLLEKHNTGLRNPDLPPSESGADLKLLDWVKSCYGLKHVAYLTTDEESRHTRTPVYRGTYSAEWQKYYRDSMAERHDPAILRGLTEILPFEWGVLKRPTLGQKKFMNRVQDFNVGQSGFSIPIRDRTGARALITMTANRKGESWRKYSHEYRKELVNLAYFLHERFALKRGLKPPMDHGAPRLTPRETEILQWTAMGKTGDEIAMIFGITRRSVDFHVTNAKTKLDTATKSHATARATALGLIVPIL